MKIDRQAAALGLQDPADHLGLVQVVGPVDELRGRRHGLVVVRTTRRGCASGGACSVRASATIAPGMVAENSIVWRVSGVVASSRSTSGRKPEVEHLVGLVEHQALHVAECPGARRFDQVDEPARGADDDLDAVLERLDLRLVGADRRRRSARGCRACLPAGCEVAGDLDARARGSARRPAPAACRGASASYPASCGATHAAGAGCRSRGSCRYRSWPGR